MVGQLALLHQQLQRVQNSQSPLVPMHLVMGLVPGGCTYMRKWKAYYVGNEISKEDKKYIQYERKWKEGDGRGRGVNKGIQGKGVSGEKREKGLRVIEKWENRGQKK